MNSLSPLCPLSIISEETRIKALIASVRLLIDKSNLLTSPWPIIGVPFSLFIGVPWILIFAYSYAFCLAASEIAIPWRPTSNLALFIMINIYSIPLPSSPSMYPMAPSSSPYAITAVGLALIPILCSIEMHFKSFLFVYWPSSSFKNLGIINVDMPFIPSGAPSVRAKTRWMMFSDISCSPYVIYIFWPLILQLFPSCSALVLIVAKSVPDCGSVKFIVPVHSPELNLGKYVFFSSSVPTKVKASINPWVNKLHRENDKFAPCQYSLIAALILKGNPIPL